MLFCFVQSVVCCSHARFFFQVFNRMVGHHLVADYTHSSVVWFSTLELIVVVLLAVLQIAFVRRLSSKIVVFVFLFSFLYLLSGVKIAFWRRYFESSPLKVRTAQTMTTMTIASSAATTTAPLSSMTTTTSTISMTAPTQFKNTVVPTTTATTTSSSSSSSSSSSVSSLSLSNDEFSDN